MALIALCGGIFTGGMAFFVQGRAFGFENVPLLAVTPAFFVGVVSAVVISHLVVRNRNTLLERLRAEKEITFRLKQEIADRKRTEEQLLQAQKMETVGKLTGGIAHDFNNLLAVIQGNAEILADRVRGEEKLTRPILRATARGAELVQRLLAFSRKQPLRPRPIEMAALVDDMSDLLRRALGATIKVEFVTGPGLWTALADRGQVENALLNLAVNARDAMPEGGRLTIECANASLDEGYAAANPEVRAGDYVMLAVSDNGPGMSADVRQQAFEPFFTTKDVGKGSGLGLSMIYGFARQSDGHVAIYSEAGRGTTVKFYLPRTSDATAAPAIAADVSILVGSGEVVLVLEDDPDVCAFTVTTLEDLRYQTIAAANAAEAWRALAAAERVDLVLSDVVLPGRTSGPAFAAAAVARYPMLKIIFMSGYPAEAAHHNGFLASDEVLLNKPFRKHELATALRRALDREEVTPPVS